ncbi:hypothetical protein NP493_285g02001 [Ridgeia piscesae]|uniref:Uncharacterized protein n=1 Tax=Ridgeia piscesae TaxID=27915 RepID=A0AAD9NX19_RIDPI|nr:hypothetical protein NP493_285g02001 [Ridgeia piscesae]
MDEKGSRRREEEGSFRNASPISFTSQLADGFRASMKSMKRVGSGFGLGATMAIKHLGDRQEQELQEYSVDTTTPLSSASIRRLIRLNAPEWLWIIGGCIGSLLNGAENPIFALVFTELLSVFIIEDKVEQEAKANIYCLVFIAIGFILAIAQFIMNYFFAQSGERLTMRIRKMAFKTMLRQDIAWFDDHSNSLGALTTRLATDASCVQGATGSRLGMLLRNLSNVGIGLILAFFFQWKLTLVICAFIPLIALAGMLEMRLITGTSVGDKKGMEQAGKVALEAIENIRTVAGLTKEQKFYEMYKKRLQEPYRNSVKKGFVVGVAFAVSQAIIYVAFAVSFLYGSHLIRQEETDFNEMFMVVAMLLFGAMGIGETLAFAPDYAKARSAASKLFALFDRVPPIDVASNEGKQIDNYSGSVEFRLVRFRYPTRPTVPVLRGLTLKVTPGKTLALVGTSGCGKSTTVSLVERFYEAVGGEVMLDGIDIKQLNLKWTRNQIGIVSQEPILFDCTIAENIAYGDNSREVTMDEIITAAKKSNIHSFIAELPLGYDTRVGDKGTQLSGGQKQRVAIARALLRNPKVLLLDEATSALDTQSERVVQEALDKARLGRTCIVIAHRLSTIQDADAIAVFHNGRVVELGTHQQLLSRRGIYYDLQQVQGKDK